jgi:hypothetical protein
LRQKPPKLASDSNGEVSVFSFVVRLWNEDSGSEQFSPAWRGHVTSIPAGERYYFTNLNEIPALIASHLKVQR